MTIIQELFNKISSLNFTLTPNEYEGPFVVDRSCVIDGCNSTLWAENGPVLVISAPDVTIKNLKVEVTKNLAEGELNTAIKTCCPNTSLENVEVKGNVIGLPGESEIWDLPNIISLGEFAANKENVFSVSIKSPANARVESRVNDLKVSPDYLKAGENFLIFTTEEMRNNTILYGEIIVTSAVKRKIYVTGKSLNEAPVHTEAIPAVGESMPSLPIQITPPKEIVAPNVPDDSVRSIRKGERVFVKDLNSSQIKIVFEHQGILKQLEVDSYCFALGENGKVSCDEDLIFFGNTESKDKSIKVSDINSKPLVLIDMEKIGSGVNKIAVCYSIYDDGLSHNFSMVSKPMVRVFGGDKEVFRFELEDLNEEKTVIAAEIYLYKDQWKMSFIGGGYVNGLKKLCENYGVNVE